MTTRMIIDARHQEETRVAVLSGNRIEEFDFESAEHKQIKGNIYLAKVTRVEPSLQAAFVDYGGNRHGFLAFSEIHPDYYQIPKEDRAALLAEEAAHAAEEAELRDEEDGDDDFDGDDNRNDDESSDGFADELINEGGDTDAEEIATPTETETLGADSEDNESETGDENGQSNQRNGRGNGRGGRRQGRGQAKASDEARAKRMALRRRYKIQDVIQRRQVLLVQVVKEERGNKGAALTTYLSLAGRYCVLMPNSAHGGGISRKISSGADRKRLKSIISEMKLPTTMGCIVRTAGLSRTKPEIKRDFDYLARLWDEIRENTLKSAAPATIHSDSDLIKRAIRDIYNREIEEVIVEGEDGYRAAKDFMKLLMPSHARRVKHYDNPTPLFQQYGAEDQLSAMYEPVVQLKSGGYLVINPTEALVSIDINSGRSTKEHGIEATALNTNMEAAREIARQLRLRDMAGLVVIDFIDMEYGNNVRKVEKAMRDALRTDRARIQVGRISGFGLMEMSRQRLRTGMLEASTRICPHCDGTGLVRTASSAGLSALRMLEEEAAQGKGSEITLRASQEATIYVLNNKRSAIAEIEERYGVVIQILPDGQTEGARMEVSATGPKPTKVVEFKPVIEPDEEEDYEQFEDEEQDEEAEKVVAQPRSRDAVQTEEGDGQPRKRRRRRRGRRNRTDDGIQTEADGTPASQHEAVDGPGGDDQPDTNTVGEPAADGSDGDTTEPAARKPRRGRRGGRGGRTSPQTADGMAEAAPDIAVAAAQTDGATDQAGEAVEEQPAKKPRIRRQPKAEIAPKAVAEAVAEAPIAETPVADAVADAPAAKPKRVRKKADGPVDAEPAEAVAEVAVAAEKPKRRSRAKAAPVDAAPEPVAAEPVVAEVVVAEPVAVESVAKAVAPDAVTEPANKRGGWWQRTFGA